MTARTNQKTATPDINSVCERLERIRRHGFFAQPRSLSNVWCRLTDDGYRVDLGILGCALSRMREKGALLRTLLLDGLLHYVDITNAGHWQSIDVPAAGVAPGTDAAGTVAPY